MAYMNQQKKAVIAAALKTVVPKDWKYTLRVRNHMEIVMVIREAPVDFFRLLYDRFSADELLQQKLRVPIQELRSLTWLEINPYRPEAHFEGDILELIKKILCCLNTGNWNNSDVQNDYFDVGHYVALKIGEWDKPYRCRANHVARQAA